MKTIFLVYVNNSSDGYGPMVLKYAFTHKASAEQMAKSLEPYGFDNQFCKVEEFPLYSCLDDWRNQQKPTLRKQALAKLTKEEKEALGL